MDLKQNSTWILVLGLIFIDAIHVVSAGYCRYINSHEEEDMMYCDGQCCSDHYKGHICCGYNSGTIVGAGVGSVFFIGFIIMCALYACCKNRIVASYHNRCGTNRMNRRTNPVHGHPDTMPTVSGMVEPTLPPPYQDLPPPYYTNDIELGEDSGENKDKKYPDHPPPAYTQFSENTS